MKEIILSLLKESSMNEKTVTEAIKKIEEVAYKNGYEEGLKEGYKNGISASIQAINFIKGVN